jgi:hypothetical protein
MAEYYYHDGQGQWRGPSTLPVLLALKESALLTSQTLIRDGIDGAPFPLADLEPTVVAVKPQALPKNSSIARKPTRTVDRWGYIARTYFTLAQIYCFISAVSLLWRLGIATFALSTNYEKVEHWIAISMALGRGLLEFCFYASLFFVFAFVKRRGLFSA